MTSNKRERDFFDARGTHLPGRFDPRLLQNVDDAGDGMPGLQKASRNWTRWLFGSGVLDIDIHANDRNIDNLASIDGGGTGIQVYDNIWMNNKSVRDINSIDGGGNVIISNDSMYIDGNLNVTGNVDIDGTLDVSGISDFHSEIDMNTNYIEGISYSSYNAISGVEIPSATNGVGKLFVDHYNRLRYLDESGYEYILAGIQYGYIHADYGDVDYIDVNTTTGGSSNKGAGYEAIVGGGVYGRVYGFFGGGEFCA